MSSDLSDDRIERAVRRAIRAELRVLGDRLFWTFVAALGIVSGFGLAVAGINTASGSATAAGLVVSGVVLIGLGARTLLLKWRPRTADATA